MDLVEDLADPMVPVTKACAALGVSRVTLYRTTQPPAPPAVASRAPSPRRLGDDERQRVLDALHSERFADQPPPEVYATLLSEGVYLASIRTMYRLLAERENAAHAERLFAETVARHGVGPGVLTVHADRGSPMRSSDLAELFAVLGVARSFSRPHVSDDDAFSEALFKTAKYQPDYPDVFASPSHGRAWFQQFVGWYNDDHQHSGLALFTPADVFYGRVDEVAARRQAALDEAYAAHPERFPNGAPVVRRPPAAVHINPLTDDDASPASGPRSSPHVAAKTPRLDAQLAAPEAIPSLVSRNACLIRVDTFRPISKST